MFRIQVCSNPLYASMVLSWSMTEVIRYSFYACGLVGKSSFALLYLRYTTFYILYPTGAFSEAFLIYATLPAYSPFPGWQSWLQGMWKPTDYIRAGLFIIWWPGNRRRFVYIDLVTSLSNQLLRSVCPVHIHDFSKAESTWTWDRKGY